MTLDALVYANARLKVSSSQKKNADSIFRIVIEWRFYAEEIPHFSNETETFALAVAMRIR
jgi:hypothetical protein